MKRFCGSVFTFCILLTSVSCASIEDVERLQGQLNAYSHASGDVRGLRADLRKVQDQIEGLERRTKTAQETTDKLRRQLVELETEQGTAATGYTAQVHQLIRNLVQGYQAEVETYRRHLQHMEQTAKGLEDLNTMTTAKPSDGQPFSPALSPMTR